MFKVVFKTYMYVNALKIVFVLLFLQTGATLPIVPFRQATVPLKKLYNMCSKRIAKT